jgi:hypothetical protein
MRKHLIFLAILFISSSVFGQKDEVSISLDAPENVIAGDKFEVTLTFNKGELEDYSRFSQDLPSGITAENISSPNADFTFSDQRVRIIWLKLPAESRVEVKYALTSDERIKGKLELEGTFAYVSNGERAYLNLPNPTVVTIMPNPDLEASAIVDISDFGSLAEPANMGEPITQESGNFATIVRQKPIIEANGIVYVNLLVNAPEGSNYMKIEERIPGGYSFESLDAGSAVVSQAASVARFVWMKAPASSVFLIRYRLIPILEQNQGPLAINGTLTYTEDGASKVVDVREETVNLEAMTGSQQTAYLESGVVPENLASVGSVTRPPVNRDPVQTKQADTKAKTSSSGQAKKEYSKSQGSGILNIPALETETGLYFRVQVAAVRNPYFAKTYFSQYDLLRDVKVEKTGGWSKFTVGSYSTYNEANQQKNKIISETPVGKAFVVAYRDGRRIPVGDVL